MHCTHDYCYSILYLIIMCLCLFPYNFLFLCFYVWSLLLMLVSYLHSIKISCLSLLCDLHHINCVILLGVAIRWLLHKTWRRMYKWFIFWSQGQSVCVLSVISCCTYRNWPLAGGGTKADLLYKVVKRCHAATGRMTDLELWISSGVCVFAWCVYTYTYEYIVLMFCCNLKVMNWDNLPKYMYYLSSRSDSVNHRNNHLCSVKYPLLFKWYYFLSWAPREALV